MVTYTSAHARWPETWTISTSSTTTLAMDTTWNTWVSAGTAGTTYTTIPYDRVWQEWQHMEMLPRRIVQPSQADLEQQRREAESRRALRDAQLLEQAERRVVAEARSLDLLQMILSPEQNRERAESQRITVHAPSGRRYRIELHNHTVHGNVVEIDEHGCPLRRGCVQPSMYDSGGPMPTADGWVGQVLAIQHNEELLRATANWSQQRNCQNPDVPILERAAYRISAGPLEVSLSWGPDSTMKGMSDQHDIYI